MEEVLLSLREGDRTLITHGQNTKSYRHTTSRGKQQVSGVLAGDDGTIMFGPLWLLKLFSDPGLAPL